MENLGSSMWVDLIHHSCVGSKDLGKAQKLQWHPHNKKNKNAGPRVHVHAATCTQNA